MQDFNQYNLFGTPDVQNILPFDGEALYYGQVLTSAKAKLYFEQLLATTEWRSDTYIMFGKRIETKRKTALYANGKWSYTYANLKRETLEWTPVLLEIKEFIERKTGATYNSCLLNLYHNGEEGMGWHADDEKDMKERGAIASFSLGAVRTFAFKHKNTAQKINISLQNGSLLVMQGSTQQNWLHAVPKSKKVLKPRINLTFRTIVL